MSGQLSSPMALGDVLGALRAGQDAKQLEPLAPDADVASLLQALGVDGLDVRRAAWQQHSSSTGAAACVSCGAAA